MRLPPPALASLLLLLLAGSALAPRPAAAEEPPAPQVAFEPAGTTFAEALERARREGRLLYVDFTSAGCGFCRLLEEGAYRDAAVVEALRPFVRLRLDGEEGEGAEVGRRRHVAGYPTLLFLDGTGQEVDRIGGYLPTREFLREVGRIARGERTLPRLREAVAKDPGDLGAALALGAKLAEADPPEGVRQLEALEARTADAPRETRAEILLTLAIALEANDQDERSWPIFERLVREMADTRAGANAGPAGIPAFLSAPPERALGFLLAAEDLLPQGEARDYVDAHTQRLFLEALANSLRRQAERVIDDPEMLNEVAWTCFERRVLPEEATAWAARAAEASGRKAHILDTWANLRFRQGEVDEAIRLEEEAVSKAPDASARAEYEETLVVFRALREHRRARAAAPPAPPAPPR